MVKRILTTIALLCLAPAATAGELVTLGAQGTLVTAGTAVQPNDPLNTGPFDCGDYNAGRQVSAQSGQTVIDYTMPQTIQLKGVLFFPGVLNRVVADVGWRLIDLTTGNVIYWTNWDHYPAPQTSASTGGPGGPLTPQQVWFPLPAGDWITLTKGDKIALQAYCSNYIGSTQNYGYAVQAHVAATLYGVVSP